MVKVEIALLGAALLTCLPIFLIFYCTAKKGYGVFRNCGWVENILSDMLIYDIYHHVEFQKFAQSIKKTEKVIVDVNDRDQVTITYRLVTSSFILWHVSQWWDTKCPDPKPNPYDFPSQGDRVWGSTYESHHSSHVCIVVRDATTGTMVDVDDYKRDVRLKLVTVLEEQLKPLIALVREDKLIRQQESRTRALELRQSTKRQRLAATKRAKQSAIQKRLQQQQQRDRLAQDIIRRHQPPPGE